MSRKYKFNNPEGIYFVSFATVGWADVFSRKMYRDIFVESLAYCQKEKGLDLYGWCIMTNHVHLIVCAKEGFLLQDIMRDLKKFTSTRIIKSIQDNHQESRKEWLLTIFKQAGERNSNNKYFQFWRQDNHPIELFTNEMMQQRIDYIHNNPVEEGIVDDSEHYIYSSARNYAGLKGLLSVKLIE